MYPIRSGHPFYLHFPLYTFDVFQVQISFTKQEVSLKYSKLWQFYKLSPQPALTVNISCWQCRIKVPVRGLDLSYFLVWCDVGADYAHSRAHSFKYHLGKWIKDRQNSPWSVHSVCWKLKKMPTPKTPRVALPLVWGAMHALTSLLKEVL